MDETFGSDVFGDIDNDELISLTIAAENQHEAESQTAAPQFAKPTIPQTPRMPRTPRTPKGSGLPTQPIEIEDDYKDLLEGAFESDDLDMSFLDDQTPIRTSTPRMPPNSSQRQIMSNSSKAPRTLPSSFNRSSSSGNLQQRTLFGGKAVESPTSPSRSGGSSNRHPFQSTQARTNIDEKPTHHRLDHEAIKTWVYPTNMTQRDYQFNIVKKALLTNTLVALPTGLGKTFIAAVVMLNFFRWCPDSQIAFLAPTKPLVEQQIHACFDICGMPKNETAVMTGSVPTKKRAEYWEDRRVFFLTPQTMHNDLKRGICDPKRIVCLVIDEAHRATGSYSYVEVVKFLRKVNTSFRILALTATPGSKVETVQEIIDNLGIAKIEIRSEEAIDIQRYIHKKQQETHVLELSPEILEIRKLYAKCMQPILDTLTEKKAFFQKNAEFLTSFGLHSAKAEWLRTPAALNGHWGFKKPILDAFGFLAQLAHPLTLLSFHGITVFYNALLNIQTEAKNSGKAEGGKLRSQFFNSDEFRELMERIDEVRRDPNVATHPKMEFLIGAVLSHLSDCKERNEETRIIVFSSFRDSADDIVKELNKHSPIVKANIFVGQADAKGSSGMTQKIQLETLEKFKKGGFNTLVATSIGEEGLDIGEVDLIICYDSNASPIRMLQRMGRTGRKRNGNIILLLTKGKEEEQSIKAKDNYNYIQRIITSGERFIYKPELAPRILPKDVTPEVDKKIIEIPPENSQPESTTRPGGKGRISKLPPKKFLMPEGAITGFFTGSGKAITKTSLKNKENSKRVESLLSDSEDEEDYDPDAEIAELDPDPQSCCLTEAEEEELRYIYSDVPDASQILVSYPDLVRFHHIQGTLRPTNTVPHSSCTERFQALKRTISELTVDPDYIARLHQYAPDAEAELEPTELDYVSETEKLTAFEQLIRTIGKNPKSKGLSEKKNTNITRTKSITKQTTKQTPKPSAKRKSLDSFLTFSDDDRETPLPPPKKTKAAPKKTPSKPAKEPPKKQPSPTPDFMDLTSSQDAAIGTAALAPQLAPTKSNPLPTTTFPTNPTTTNSNTIHILAQPTSKRKSKSRSKSPTKRLSTRSTTSTTSRSRSTKPSTSKKSSFTSAKSLCLLSASEAEAEEAEEASHDEPTPPPSSEGPGMALNSEMDIYSSSPVRKSRYIADSEDEGFIVPTQEESEQEREERRMVKERRKGTKKGGKKSGKRKDESGEEEEGSETEKERGDRSMELLRMLEVDVPGKKKGREKSDGKGKEKGKETGKKGKGKETGRVTKKRTSRKG